MHDILSNEDLRFLQISIPHFILLFHARLTIWMNVILSIPQ